ncbi:MAG: twin-arginine translocation signal domain-containing protein, partial [Verrucomicrobia bacterium]|nr:twin-arginine translocation signal domain-containing protein [Verrucomicrobiota bacterium]
MPLIENTIRGRNPGHIGGSAASAGRRQRFPGRRHRPPPSRGDDLSRLAARPLNCNPLLLACTKQCEWNMNSSQNHHATIAMKPALLPRPCLQDLSRRDFLGRLGLVGVATLAGCSDRSAPQPGGAATPGSLKQKRVGLSSPHQVEILNELYADMKREAQKPENQLELVIVDAKNDAVKQLNDIESFIAQGYGGIFFLAQPSTGLTELVAK